MATHWRIDVVYVLVHSTEEYVEKGFQRKEMMFREFFLGHLVLQEKTLK